MTMKIEHPAEFRGASRSCVAVKDNKDNLHVGRKAL